MYTVKNVTGLHARPVACLLKAAKECQCEAFVKKGEAWEAAGMINLLLLAAGCGATLELGAQGEKAELCLNAWQKLFDCDFPQLDKDASSKES